MDDTLRFKEMLNEVLAWCVSDANNEDGYATQEMMENRVEVLIEVLDATD